MINSLLLTQIKLKKDLLAVNQAEIVLPEFNRKSSYIFLGSSIRISGWLGIPSNIMTFNVYDNVYHLEKSKHFITQHLEGHDEFLDFRSVPFTNLKGQEYSTMVSVSVCRASCPGLSPVRSVWDTIEMLLTCSNSATDWFIKGHVMCYHVYVIMHVKDP